MKKKPHPLFIQALQAFQEGAQERALQFFLMLLEVEPKNFDALHITGVLMAMKDDHKEAINYFAKAIKVNAINNLAHFNLAKALSDSGDDLAALKYHINATKLAPSHAEAWLNYGKSLSKLCRFEEAIQKYNKALQLKSDLMEALSNKGAALTDLGLFADGLALLNQAIQINPTSAEAWSNRGIALGKLRCFEEALSSYDQSLKINANYVVAWLNKGAILAELKRYEEALNCYDEAIRLQPNYVDAWSNKAELLSELKRFDEALDCYKQAMKIAPKLDFLYGQYVQCKMNICDWTDFDLDRQRIEELVRLGHKAVGPFAALGLFDQPDLQYLSAAIYAKYKFGELSADRKSVVKFGRKKIRIAYFSSDFRNHPVSYLIAELIELHDRERFEVFGFSSGPDNQDEMKQRMLNAFDQFIDVHLKSASEVVKLCDTLEIDIAIDLGGYTSMARPEIFAQRVAPIQVSYLGFIGTLGSNFMDYIVADRVVIPEDQISNFSEKIIYLPNCYQVSDSKRKVSTLNFHRKELGLPEHGFVFCCFNNSYKIHPSSFQSWMRILKQVEGSVLWLLQDNQFMVENLNHEAEQQGIDPARLVFADRVSHSEFLARLKVADLFLDTVPYNAGTTANDALFSGLPVLTLQGHSFVSRMASSLLHAMNLDELVVKSVVDYEKMAIELAQNPEMLQELKRNLAHKIDTSTLFDTEQSARHIEMAYEKIYERAMAGLMPETINV